MREYVQALFATQKDKLGCGRRRCQVSCDHYDAFVRVNRRDEPTDPLRCLYFIDAFVKEVYAQDGSCLLHDSLWRVYDKAVDGVARPFFRCNTLVDCACDEQCDWQHAFGQRHSLLIAMRRFEPLLAWDDSRELGEPYSVDTRPASKSITLLDCKGICTISGCEEKHRPWRINGWRTTFTATRHDKGWSTLFCGICLKHRTLIGRCSRRGKGRPKNESELRAAIFGDSIERPLFKDGTTEEREGIHIRFRPNTNGITTSGFALYTRSTDEMEWHLSMPTRSRGVWPKKVRLCREDDARERIARIRMQ